MSEPFLSVIVPAYNESGRIRASILSIVQYLSKQGFSFEILAVNDGSADDTGEIIETLGRELDCVRPLSYPVNRGKGHAIRAGVAASRGRYVMFTDADLTVPISIVDDFLAALQNGFDIAVASREHPDSAYQVPPPLQRRVMGRVFSWFVRLLIVNDLRDTQCGGKAYRGEVARDLFSRQRIDHFSFDAEVIFLAVRSGYRIKEVPFLLRYTPGSTIRPVADSIRMLHDLVQIRINAIRGDYDR